eukprot:TRINITY_DN34260_c0_g1_i1.p1 TRINITY_DN34260_c0_g1~~TRINITY_DN34260_c0_g1_i1.p1  ORF type:complete len:235 (+),score=17.99 TRINITY_DN34260_c0_g1_i1:54-707(+)
METSLFRCSRNFQPGWSKLPDEVWSNVISFVLSSPEDLYLIEYEINRSRLCRDMYIPVASSERLQGRLLHDGSALLCDGQSFVNQDDPDCSQIQPEIGHGTQRQLVFSESGRCLFVHTWMTSTTCQSRQQMQAHCRKHAETVSHFGRSVQPVGLAPDLVCSCAALCKQIHRGYARVLPRGYRYKVPARFEFHDPVDERTLLLGVDRDKETVHFVEQD